MSGKWTIPALAGRLLGMLKAKEQPAQQLEMDRSRIPAHIAVIMDGHGRWATKRSLPRSAGHSAGVEALRAIIRECDDLKVKALTIYAFSTENWTRSPEEVGALMNLLLKYFSSEIDELHEKGVCIRILGDVGGLPAPQRDAVNAAMERTKDNTGLKLNIALNYGGRDELVRAVNGLISSGKSRITEEDIDFALDTAGCAAPDVIVRTGGEQRLSNFLMWQSAYSELYFSDALWPDYSSDDVDETVRWFAGRSRRFGGI